MSRRLCIPGSGLLFSWFGPEEIINVQDDSIGGLPPNKIDLEVIFFPIITSIVSVRVIMISSRIGNKELTTVITSDGEKDISV